uniref:Putative serine recombinase n=1 Tax=Plagiogrammopsis vanheurckii TaxID=1234821 RepID=A0A2U9NN91_9STRA|nr:putative serine recombinase [Plagiogrammopsis vanheurckii]YP_009496203.1 putative serine recombinase [Plagiogrammopsis vanheurckii]AWT38589.1 putative serine recombinase [Plagiogrammopsis vanheurckii]AWT38643.1 putative serine recombinase [Plagiogrammopsis vanheurckii]
MIFIQIKYYIGGVTLMTKRFEQISKQNRYGYGRVSVKEQAENCSLDAQKVELIKLGVPEKNIYLEVGSATDVLQNRPIFFKLIDQILKEGDLLAVTKFDRCSRNTLSFLQLKNQLSEKGVAFLVLDLPQQYLENSPSSQLISTALATISEFETARRLERQRQGIEAAKQQNKYKGRKSVVTRDLIKRVEKYKNLGVSVTEIARITGKSRSTIYKVLKEELGYISNHLIKEA